MPLTVTALLSSLIWTKFKLPYTWTTASISYQIKLQSPKSTKLQAKGLLKSMLFMCDQDALWKSCLDWTMLSYSPCQSHGVGGECQQNSQGNTLLCETPDLSISMMKTSGPAIYFVLFHSKIELAIVNSKAGP